MRVYPSLAAAVCLLLFHSVSAFDWPDTPAARRLTELAGLIKHATPETSPATSGSTTLLNTLNSGHSTIALGPSWTGAGGAEHQPFYAVRWLGRLAHRAGSPGVEPSRVSCANERSA